MKKSMMLLVAFALSLGFASTAVAKRSCVCTKQYAPVCARIGTKLKTYGNSCMARCQRAKICAKGKCKGCPVYRLAKPAPGCKYIWRWKGCCRVPKLVCKARKPYCTKLRCKRCNKPCLKKKKACFLRARRLNAAGVVRIRRACLRSSFRARNRCLCTWATRRAPAHVILKGMRSCLLRKCKKYRCCKKGRKLCIPHKPGVRCVRRPCCKKLICAPRRCR